MKLVTEKSPLYFFHKHWKKYRKKYRKKYIKKNISQNTEKILQQFSHNSKYLWGKFCECLRLRLWKNTSKITKYFVALPWQSLHYVIKKVSASMLLTDYSHIKNLRKPEPLL